MKQYDSYKDSGVEWIGEVPSHWEILRGKYVLSILSGFPFDSKKFEYDDRYMPLIRIRDINNSSTEVYYSGDYPKESVIKKGEVLIGMDGDFNVSRWNGPNALLNQRVCKINECSKMNTRYAFYMLSLPLTVINNVTYATTVKHLSVYDIYNTFLPVPTIIEQEGIANYLDKKCSEIDNVISAQQKRIALLQELKQSVITHAVTKGLNPNVEMKDSGVEWIGKVPKHWEVMKTSLAFNGIGSGTTPSTSKKEFYDDEGKYWLQTGDLNDGMIFDTSKKVSDVAIKACNLKFYPKDSVVIAMYGATIGKVGILGIKTATNQACCVLPANKYMVAKYSFYEFFACKPALLVSAIGGGQPNISQDTIRKQKIAVPPYIEQQEIAGYLDKKCASIDSAISKAQHQVELLQEYKQSLITEVVTGKRKVS